LGWNQSGLDRHTSRIIHVGRQFGASHLLNSIGVFDLKFDAQGILCISASTAGIYTIDARSGAVVNVSANKGIPSSTQAPIPSNREKRIG